METETKNKKKGGIKKMKQFEIEFKMNDKTIYHKIVDAKNIPKMFIELSKEFINSTLTIKRLK